MSEATRRYMRLLVFFDLPVTTREKKRIYTLFRRFLIQDGYDMIQWSVYGRMVNGIDDAEKHLKRLGDNLPKEGSIRCLQVSEKQFANMRLLVGTKSFQEKRSMPTRCFFFERKKLPRNLLLLRPAQVSGRGNCSLPG